VVSKVKTAKRLLSICRHIAGAFQLSYLVTSYDPNTLPQLYQPMYSPSLADTWAYLAYTFSYAPDHTMSV
jgi:hypothetical protein